MSKGPFSVTTFNLFLDIGEKRTSITNTEHEYHDGRQLIMTFLHVKTVLNWIAVDVVVRAETEVEVAAVIGRDVDTDVNLVAFYRDCKISAIRIFFNSTLTCFVRLDYDPVCECPSHLVRPRVQIPCVAADATEAAVHIPVALGKRKTLKLSCQV